MKSSFNHETGKPEYKGAMDVIVKVIRNEGFFSLWLRPNFLVLDQRLECFGVGSGPLMVWCRQCAFNVSRGEMCNYSYGFFGMNVCCGCYV